MGKYRHKPKALPRKFLLRQEAKASKKKFEADVREKTMEIMEEIGHGNVTSGVVKRYGYSKAGRIALCNLRNRFTKSAARTMQDLFA